MSYILVFGDSIIYGAWDFEEGGWVNRLRKFLDKKIEKDHDKYFFIVYNLGIDGHTTKDWLDLFEKELISRTKIAKKYNEPITVIISLGENDATFIKSKNGNRVPKEEFKNNLKNFVSISKRFTEKVILITLIPVDERFTTPAGFDEDLYWRNEDIQEYSEIIKSVAKEENILCIDLFNEFLKEKNFTSFDGLHPNAEGHRKIFEIVKDFLIENKFI